MRTLFGDHDPAKSVRAREVVAKLFGEHDDLEESSRVREAMATFFGDRTTTDATPAEDGSTCGASDLPHPDEETRHELHFDDRVEYAHCIDGALIPAELIDGEPVTVRSYDPVTGEPVTYEISEAGREVTPDDAVVSIGMARDVPDSENVRSFGIAMARGGPYHHQVQYQTHYGQRDLFGPLIENDEARVLPIQDRAGNLLWMVEVYPAATLGILSLYRQGYKDQSKSAEWRAKNLEGLRNWGATINDTVAEECRESDDALDSLTVAVGVFRALQEDFPKDDYGAEIEGQIYA